MTTKKIRREGSGGARKGAGRPPVDPTEKRSARLVVLLIPEEYASVVVAAMAAKELLPEFARNTLFSRVNKLAKRHGFPGIIEKDS